MYAVQGFGTQVLSGDHQQRVRLLQLVASRIDSQGRSAQVRARPSQTHPRRLAQTVAFSVCEHGMAGGIHTFTFGTHSQRPSIHWLGVTKLPQPIGAGGGEAGG